jgi:hypothetical protein
MIKPSKYTDLNKSAIKIIASILSILKKNKVMEYTELLNKLKHIYSEDVKYSYIQCLNLLYLFGKIKYYPENDLFELVEE